MKRDRDASGFILLDVIVSLPILVFLLAAMGAMADSGRKRAATG